MDSLSSHNERQQLEEDIQRIKYALQASSGDWSLSYNADAGDSEDEEDALRIICPKWTSYGECDNEAPASKGLEVTVDTDAYIRPPSTPQDDSSLDNDQLIQMGVALNRAYQDIVNESLEFVQVLLAQNRERQEEVQESISENLTVKSLGGRSVKKRNPSSYGYPYFRDKDGLPPPMNYEAQCKKATEEPEAFVRPVRIWTKKEQQTLQRAVHEDLTRQKIQPILNRKELDLEKLVEATNQNDANLVETLKERIKKHDDDIKEIKNNPLDISTDVDSYINTIDWMKISNIDFNAMRRADECYVYWRNHLQPAISNARWTPQEDKRLSDLAKQHECHNWEVIAQKLGTNRSAFQCLQRYQTKLNPCLQAGKWSVEEDNFLKEVVASVCTGDTIPWDQVSYYVENRSNEQCELRWQQLQNSYKAGRWTEEEDKLLVQAVDRYGKEWIKVQEMVPNRTAQQCRERYMNTLSRGTKFGFWRYHEDKALWLRCQGQTTFKWSQIANDIPGRSDNACLQRYRLLSRLKYIEDILLKTPDGKVVVDKLLRRKPKPKLGLPSQSSRDAKIRMLRRKIAEQENIIADAEKKIDLLNIRTTYRTQKSLQFQKDKIARAKETIVELQEAISKCQQKGVNVTSTDPVKYQDLINDINEAVRDRENGIYVPRPLVSTHGLRMVLSSLESQLQFAIQKKTQQVLRDISKGKHINPDTSTGIDEATRTMQHMTKPKVSTNRGRRKISEEEIKINQQIFDLLHDYNRKESAGRPRKFGRRQANDPEEERKLHMEQKVFQIFVNALNFDVEGAKKQGRNHMAKLTQDSDDICMRALQADLELFQRAFNCNLEGGQQSQPSKPTLSNSSLQIPRPALRGDEARRAYHLPPLPPSVSTLMAFKSLLLKRRQLIEMTNNKAGPVSKKREAGHQADRGSKKQKLNEPKQSNHGAGDLLHDAQQAGKEGNVSTTLISHLKGIVDAGTAVTVSWAHCSDQTAEGQIHGMKTRSIISEPGQVQTGETLAAGLCNVSLNKPESQPRVMIVKGHNLTPDVLSQVMRARGITADPEKIKLQMCIRSDLVKHIEQNLSQDRQAVGQKAQSKQARRRALMLLKHTHDYQLLKARFTSLFLWPALLSTIMIEPEKEKDQQQEWHKNMKHQPQQSNSVPAQQQEPSEDSHSEGRSRDSQGQGAEVDVSQPGQQTMEEHLEDELDETISDEGSLVIPPELLKSPDGKTTNSTKKTKKHVTKRNRYPCSCGKRFRKRTAQRREIKEKQLENYRKAKEKYLMEKAKQKQQALNNCVMSGDQTQEGKEVRFPKSGSELVLVESDKDQLTSGEKSTSSVMDVE